MSALVRRTCNLSRVEKDLKAVTCIDGAGEVSAEDAGLTDAGLDAIWRTVEALYRTGVNPGIQLALRHRGKLVMNRSIGHSRGNGPNDAPSAAKQLMAPDTPFCYFSASKAVTALLIHMLAEDGLVSMIDPISFYLPEFGQEGKQDITIHQILSHRGGIPGLPASAGLDALWDQDEVWRLLCETKPIAVDGRNLAYHAITGGFVLGRLLEKVTGLTLNEFIDLRLRQPMGMRHFTYGVPDGNVGAVAMNYATGPTPRPPLSWVVKRALGADIYTVAEIANDPRFLRTVIPAGNLVGTAEEMSRFYQMMLNEGRWGGKQVCSPLTVRRAICPHGTVQLDRTLLIPMRFSAGFMLGMSPVGLWGPGSRKAFGHVGLINKWCWADPQRDISVTLLTSGIPIFAHHLPHLARFVWTVCRVCQPQPGQSASKAPMMSCGIK